MKKTILFEILFFIIVPLLIWNVGKDYIGDYWAIFLSTVPGLLFGVFQFIKQKQLNFTGIAFISTMLLGVIVDLLSPNAEQMLWNGIYLSCFYAFIYLASIIIKRPIVLYFSVDFAYLQGHKREDSKALFYRKELLSGFQWMTALFIIRMIFFIVLKSWMLVNHGVDGYNSIIITVKVCGWIFNGIIFGGFIILSNKIYRVAKELYGDEEDEVENEEIAVDRVSS